MDQKTAFSFSAHTGEYAGEVTAWADPMNPGEFLLPGNATYTKPPKFKKDHVRVWTGEKWEAVKGEGTLGQTTRTEEQVAHQVRVIQRRLLMESDWTQLGDAGLTTDCLQSFREYRQALRDVTAQPDFPLEVSWPLKPYIVKS